MEEEEEEEEDQGGKEDDGKSTRDSKRDGGVESNRTALGFRSDRATKTNRRAFCSRFVAVAIPVDVRSPADRIQSIELSRSDCYVHGSRNASYKILCLLALNTQYGSKIQWQLKIL